MGVQTMSLKIYGWYIDAGLFLEAAEKYIDENEIGDMCCTDERVWEMMVPQGVFVCYNGSTEGNPLYWHLYVAVIKPVAGVSRKKQIEGLTEDQIKTAKEFAQRFSVHQLGIPAKQDLLQVLTRFNKKSFF